MVPPSLVPRARRCPCSPRRACGISAGRLHPCQAAELIFFAWSGFPAWPQLVWENLRWSRAAPLPLRRDPAAQGALGSGMCGGSQPTPVPSGCRGTTGRDVRSRVWRVMAEVSRPHSSMWGQQDVYPRVRKVLCWWCLILGWGECVCDPPQGWGCCSWRGGPGAAPAGTPLPAPAGICAAACPSAAGACMQK